MTACPTCGRAHSNPALRVFLWIAGIAAAGIIALPFMILFGLFILGAIGAMGDSANESFAEISQELNAVEEQSFDTPQAEASSFPATPALRDAR